MDRERKRWMGSRWQQGLVGCLLALLGILFVYGCSPSVENVLVGVDPAKPSPGPKRDTTCTCGTTPPATSTSASGSAVTPPSATTTAPPSPTITTPPATTTATTPPVTVTVAPPVVVDTLPVAPPRFVPNGGTFKVGTSVQLVADAVPDGGIAEYSIDEGKNWLRASPFALMDGGKFLSRIRVGTRTTRVRETAFNVSYERVLIIGNSIMSHAPAPSKGWLNFNGMAASAPEKDFVHVLTRQLQALNPGVVITLQSGGTFERQFWQYDLSEFDDALRNKPDLIIVRIAENVDQDLGVVHNFEKHYRTMLDYLAARAAPTRKIVCSTSFWNQPRTDAVIQKVGAEKGYPVACLCGLVGWSQYMATEYKDPDVAMHPNDRGMAEIARLLWEKIQ